MQALHLRNSLASRGPLNDVGDLCCIGTVGQLLLLEVAGRLRSSWLASNDTAVIRHLVIKELVISRVPVFVSLEGVLTTQYRQHLCSLHVPNLVVM